MRGPTDAELMEFGKGDGRFMWSTVGGDWTCPACRRSRAEIVRWIARSKGWWGSIVLHHDHLSDDGRPPRFPMEYVCDDCNRADAHAKIRLKLPKDFSFSPAEISMFIRPERHQIHSIDYDLAERLYLRFLVDRASKEEVTVRVPAIYAPEIRRIAATMREEAQQRQEPQA